MLCKIFFFELINVVQDVYCFSHSFFIRSIYNKFSLRKKYKDQKPNSDCKLSSLYIFLSRCYHTILFFASFFNFHVNLFVILFFLEISFEIYVWTVVDTIELSFVETSFSLGISILIYSAEYYVYILSLQTWVVINECTKCHIWL